MKKIAKVLMGSACFDNPDEITEITRGLVGEQVVYSGTLKSYNHSVEGNYDCYPITITVISENQIQLQWEGQEDTLTFTKYVA